LHRSDMRYAPLQVPSFPPRLSRFALEMRPFLGAWMLSGRPVAAVGLVAGPLGEPIVVGRDRLELGFPEVYREPAIDDQSDGYVADREIRAQNIGSLGRQVLLEHAHL